MFAIFIGLFAVSEAIRPGMQLPKIPVFLAATLAIATDVLVIVLLFTRVHLHVHIE